MPVYNEERAIRYVLEEWQQALLNFKFNYTFCILNDGSTDNTLDIINKVQHDFPQIKIVNKENSGHGQTCVYGYRLALDNGADWIFQIDSDGQCDPRYFRDFVQNANEYYAVYGVRKSRDDGFQRIVVSKFVVLFVFAATGVWVRDSNVPYRLIHSTVMKEIVDKIPQDFHLANILVAVLTKKHTNVKWTNIHFRNRMGGLASVKTFSFIKHGFRLFKQLKKAAVK